MRVVQNDTRDRDGAADQLQNYPTITLAVVDGARLDVRGTLASRPNATFRIEFFAGDSCDPSGYGEGRRFIGFVNGKTGGDGRLSFAPSVSALVGDGEFITATATDQDGDTSEFSRCVRVAE